MSYRKTAIAMPADLLAEVDRIARDRGESRSRFISHVLRAAVRARRDADITRRLDELFADSALSDAQRREAGELDEIGTSFTDERW